MSSQSTTLRSDSALDERQSNASKVEPCKAEKDEAKADKLTDWAIDTFLDDVAFGETKWVHLYRNEQKTRLKALYSASNQWV